MSFISKKIILKTNHTIRTNIRDSLSRISSIHLQIHPYTKKNYSKLLRTIFYYKTTLQSTSPAARP